jgi:hypothetical protein
MAPPRPAETLPTPAETNTSHTNKLCEQNLAGAPTLLQGFGGYTRVCASAHPRNGTSTRREECPISEHQSLRVPNGYPRRGSGATIGDSHRGPLITGGKPIFLQITKTQTNSQDINYTQSGRPQHPSSETPLRSRGTTPHHRNSASLEGWTPPRARLRLAQDSRGSAAPAPTPPTGALTALTQRGCPGQRRIPATPAH